MGFAFYKLHNLEEAQKNLGEFLKSKQKSNRKRVESV